MTAPAPSLVAGEVAQVEQVESTLDAALIYASNSWAVMPIHNPIKGGCSCGKKDCQSIGKHPRTRHGLKDATTDPEVIWNWFQQLPSANVGIATGAVSGLCVIDIDLRHGGEDTWQALIQKHGRTPDTLEVLTGGGGRHLYFKHPGIYIQSRSNVWSGIDVRADGGLVVAPPSLHVSGRRYEFESSCDANTPLAYLPGWMRDVLIPKAPAITQQPEAQVKPSYTPTGQKFLTDAIQKAGPGNRNEVGFWLSTMLRDDGLSRNDAEIIMLDFQRTVTTPDNPYTEAEALASLDEAYSRPAREPAKNTNNHRQDHAPQHEESTQTTQDSQPRFIVHSAADALRPQPPIQYLVDSLIAPRSVTVLFADGGTGKSTAALSLGVCVAANLPWLGFKTRAAKVLVIDQEMGLSGFSQRLGEVLRGEELGPETQISYVCFPDFMLDSKNDPTILTALIESENASLVILDALSELMSGDENAKEDVQPVFTALRKIAEKTGTAILVIHHSNKAGGYRGSTTIKSSVDLLLRLDAEEPSNILTFATEKNRYGKKSKWSAVATWSTNASGESIYTLRSCSVADQVQHYSKSQSYVLDFLDRHQTPASMGEIEAGADQCSPNAARQAVYSLVSRGKVYRTNPGARGVQALYALKKDDENDIPL